MKVKITWLSNGFVQVRELVNCRADKGKQSYFTMNSPIYQAIANGSFVMDLGEFGKHPFKIDQLS